MADPCRLQSLVQRPSFGGAAQSMYQSTTVEEALQNNSPDSDDIRDWALLEHPEVSIMLSAAERLLRRATYLDEE